MIEREMFKQLEAINGRPEPFEFYTASDLWTNEHTSQMMLSFHLKPETDVSSRNAKFINHSVEWIASRFKVGLGTKIADFGCGPGLYATQLAQRQASVTGIDFSRRSIHYARSVAQKEGLCIRYETQNYLDYETNDRFHLILMIMCDFCALSPVQRQLMLRKFHKLLEPGGSVLLDVYSLNAFEKREEMGSYGANLLNGFWSSQKYYGFLNTFKYDEEKVVLDKYTIVDAQQIRTVYNWLQYFEPNEIEKEFLKSGFTIDKFYSDVAGTPYDSRADEFAVLANKP